MKTKQENSVFPILILLLCTALALGGWNWYNANVDRSGWQEAENGVRYLDFHGKPVSGWLEIHGNFYYFGEDTLLATHWQEIDGQHYYLGDDGIRVTGWQKIGENRYCFAENGAMCTGWVELDGRNCYLGTDGLPCSGWLEDSTDTYYLDEMGFPITGMTALDGKTYLFDETGRMHTGWYESDGQHYYFHPDGTMATGFTKLEENTYYFQEDGIQHFGWLALEDHTYYFQDDGAMTVGPMEIDGKQYYFGLRGENIILVNPWNFLPADVQIDLVDIGNQHSVDRACADALAQMLKACQDAGYHPYVCSSYRTQEYQQSLLDNKIARVMNDDPSLTWQQAYNVARRSVAVPGTSEHQLGLAVDIVANGYIVLDYTQANTSTQKWLMENCWDYGFILRYPDGASDITGIIYEPWHYRYVGVEIAKEIQSLGITLEEYVGAVVTD